MILNSYFGNKRQSIKYIEPLWTPYRDTHLFVDVFTGGLNVIEGLDLYTAIANDANADLIHLYNTIQVWEKRGFNLDRIDTTNNAETYYRNRDIFNHHRHTHQYRAELYFYLLQHCWSGLIRYNKRGEFNTSYGRDPLKDRSFLDIDVEKISDRLTGIAFYALDYVDLYDLVLSREFYKSMFLYLDPPYVGMDTMYQYGSKDFDFDNLIKQTIDLHCPFIVQNVHNDYVMDALHRYKKPSNIQIVPIHRPNYKQNRPTNEVIAFYE